MGYFLLGAAAIGAAGSVISSNSASDSRNQAVTDARNGITGLQNSAVNGNFLGQYGTSDIFGTVPDAASYNPVAPLDFTQNQRDTITGNLRNLPAAERLSSSTNAFNLGQSLDRINALVPNYQKNLDQMGSVTKDLLLGRLPYSDVLDITSNRSSLGANLGVPGGTANATLKDLGLSQLSAETTGANMFETMLQGAQQVMPTSMLNDPSKMFYDPTTRAQLELTQRGQDIEQAQLSQQSEQSANNLAASPDPAAASLFNLQAGLIPATLGISAGGNTGAGIAGASSAIGGSLSQAALLQSLQSRQQQQQQPAVQSPGLYFGGNNSTYGYDGSGNLVPYNTSGYGYPQVNPNATF